MTSRKPYENKLTYDTENFQVRMVEENDAENLLSCYADPKSAPLFNSDNCTCNFVYEDVEALRKLIQFWSKEYNNGYYVRFSLIDKKKNSAIGTIEMFAKEVKFQGGDSVGVLRLDLASEYETKQYLDDIMTMVQMNFFDDFGVEHVMTKAIPMAEERIEALMRVGYVPVNDLDVSGQDRDYFIGKRGTYGDYNKTM